MKYVWYAGYGSNLMRDRFLTYINGGRPPGSTAHEAGCRDQSAPLEDRPLRIPYPLYFSRNAARWNGGVAFIGHQAERDNDTLGRIFLITEQQFSDVFSQENGGTRLTVSVDDLRRFGSQHVATSWYGKVVCLGDIDGYPVLTFTATLPYSPDIVNPPSLAYLELISTGLRETYDMSGVEIARYLAEKPGVREHYSAQDLACL